MVEFLQQILLSDVVLFVLMGVVMLLITSWAYSSREYAGYILGWLLGILLSILLSIFSSGIQVSPHNTALIEGPMMLVGLVATTVVGLSAGFIALALVDSERYRISKVRRALAVAIATSFTITGGYFMLISGYSTRLMIVVFTLALAIGALFNYVFSFARLTQPRQATPADIVSNLETTDYRVDDPVSDLDVPSPLAQRIHNLQNRMRHRDLE